MARKSLSLALLTLVVALVTPLAGRTSPGGTDTATPVTFGPGSFIIPMDTALNGQDNGMLRAYGLVYALLRSHVPVHWAIDPDKVSNGDDFSVIEGLEDVETSASIGARSYSGGPFVIDAANAAAALPIIQAWQAVVGDSTVVHRLTAGSFSATVDRTLIGAPRIAILNNGNEAIAFNNLNAAGILDSSGAAWSASSPDLLTEVQVSGPTASTGDGALFDAGSGLARICYLASMSYVSSANTPQVVQEVRSWLDSSPLTHAFMQNSAATMFENDTSGLFLTTAGIQDVGAAPSPVANRVPADPLTQIAGALVVDSGAVDSIGLAGGSFKTGVRTLINEATSTLLTDIVLLHGRLDGDIDNGQVTYLAGHDYSVALPVSANPQTNGVRLFLNSVLASGCATETPEDVVALTKSAPAYTNTNQITYTIAYSNLGPRVAEQVRITDRVPAGTAFDSAPLGEGGVYSGGVVTWNIGSVAPGGGGSLTFTVNVTGGDGIYNNATTMNSSQLTVGTTWSNVVATESDTVAPTVTIPGAPTNLTVTADDTPSFLFEVSAGGTPATPECRVIDSPAPVTLPDFGPCTDLFLFTVVAPLVDGNYTFQARATDAAGNIGPVAEHAFQVETAPPIDPCTTTPLLDNFNRADGRLGSNWLDPTNGAFGRIKSNRVDVQGGGPVYWNAASFGTNQAAFVTLSQVHTRSQSHGLLLKIQPGTVPEAGAISVVYDARAGAVRVSTLQPLQNDWTAYAAAPATFVDGDQLGGCVTSDGVVSVYKNNVVVATVTLSAPDQAFFNAVGGKIGLWALKAPQVLFDDFRGGTVVR